jgi:hypothetical protein
MLVQYLAGTDRLRVGERQLLEVSRNVLYTECSFMWLDTYEWLHTGSHLLVNDTGQL